MGLNLVLIFGLVRSDRRGIRAVRFLEGAFAARGHAVATIDPVEYELPLLDKMYKQYATGSAPAPLEALAGMYRQAAFVIVTGEYNHTMPPPLMNLAVLNACVSGDRPCRVRALRPRRRCAKRTVCERLDV
jgi:NAD(P)H-dependent FMN reductase